MTFDPTKPCTTRDGRKAEVLRVLKNGDIVAVVTESDGREWSATWRGDGTFYSFVVEGRTDLVNTPVKHVRYVNLYLNRSGYKSRDSADIAAGDDRVACVRVEFTEGQFDE